MSRRPAAQKTYTPLPASLRLMRGARLASPRGPLGALPLKPPLLKGSSRHALLPSRAGGCQRTGTNGMLREGERRRGIEGTKGVPPLVPQVHLGDRPTDVTRRRLAAGMFEEMAAKTAGAALLLVGAAAAASVGALPEGSQAAAVGAAASIAGDRNFPPLLVSQVGCGFPGKRIVRVPGRGLARPSKIAALSVARPEGRKDKRREGVGGQTDQGLSRLESPPLTSPKQSLRPPPIAVVSSPPKPLPPRPFP